MSIVTNLFESRVMLFAKHLQYVHRQFERLKDKVVNTWISRHLVSRIIIPKERSITNQLF